MSFFFSEEMWSIRSEHKAMNGNDVNLTLRKIFHAIYPTSADMIASFLSCFAILITNTFIAAKNSIL